MNMKKFMKVAQIALGTGLYLLDQSDRASDGLRERFSDQVDDIRDRADDLRGRAKDTYNTATDRVSRASQVLRGDDESAIWDILRFAAGLGIGIGVGLLIAPANGEETRAKLAEKAQEFGGTVRDRFASHDLRPTGTGV